MNRAAALWEGYASMSKLIHIGISKNDARLLLKLIAAAFMNKQPKISVADQDQLRHIHANIKQVTDQQEIP